MSDTPPPSTPEFPSSWDDEHRDAARGGGRRIVWWGLGAIVAVVLVILGVNLIFNRGADEERAWPEAVDGRPEGLGGEKETAAEVTPSAAPGVYIWNSFDGWHLWVVNGDGIEGLTGTIRSNVDLVGGESSAPDAGTVSVDGKIVTFDLDGEAAVAGVDFDPGFASQLTFELQTADGEVAPAQVFTGSGSAPVDAVPVVIDKPVVD
jgi:hypothetical protein